MKFTVQHTCSNENGVEYVLKNAPFCSHYIPEKDKKPFLGEGFYFWEYNEEYAKYWGKKNYNNKFFVCESNIQIDHETDGYYLDLAGNREHLVGFVELLSEFNLIHKEGTKGVDLCWIIDYIRKNLTEEEFPFEVIRAVDYNNDDKAGIKIEFNDLKHIKSYTILNPRMIICYKNKDKIVYLSEPFIKFAS